MEMKEMMSHNLERLLGELGLERRRSGSDFLLPALGVFAAGAIVGGVLGLLLAPSSGRELRSEIEKKLSPEPAHNGSPAPRV